MIQIFFGKLIKLIRFMIFKCEFCDKPAPNIRHITRYNLPGCPTFIDRYCNECGKVGGGKFE
jgi:hypothetical protein